MKLIELEINNIRGIKHFKIEPKSENFVIWGPNGSGKSSVVDSIDFLLTGQISRLTGRGAGVLSLEKHGPHVDCSDAHDSWVRGVFQIDGIPNPLELKRCLDAPRELEYDETYKTQLDSIFTIAKRGQHILTRRDILRFITSEGSTRAKEIQELLDLTEIEKIRNALVTAKNKLEEEKNGTVRAVETTKGRIKATVSLTEYDEEKILEEINNNRSTLGGIHLMELNSVKLKENLQPPVLKETESKINLALVERSTESLKIDNDEFKKKIAGKEEDLRKNLQALSSDPILLRNLSFLQLFELGVRLLDDSGTCPLCDTPWEKDKLKSYLHMKISRGKEAGEIKKKIDNAIRDLSSIASTVQGNIENVLVASNELKLTEETEKLEAWIKKIEELQTYLVSQDYSSEIPFSSQQVNTMFYPKDGSKFLETILEKSRSEYPETTPEQDAWDILTRLEVHLKNLEDELETDNKAQLFYQRASILYSKYIETRDIELIDLYDSIKNRFVYLYSLLHEVDESGFGAALKPDGAALDLQVDFYGRGWHPPHALHSEGHQDSMGLCLWLALSEFLTQGIIDILILDDVVMSVDADHRRKTCELLAKEFRGRQFFITTHDRNWVSLLTSGGVIKSRNVTEFYNWDIFNGPQASNQVELWPRIEEDFKKGDVSGAAHKLRRGSEDYFRLVCDALAVPVVFKESMKWELGELLPPAMSEFNHLISVGKEAANSYNQREKLEWLKELDSCRKSIYQRTNADQWMMNESIHYNNWGTLSVNDFKPLVEAFKDLFDVFRCSKCGGLLRISYQDRTPKSINCPCDEYSWNLLRKTR